VASEVTDVRAAVLALHADVADAVVAVRRRWSIVEADADAADEIEN